MQASDIFLNSERRLRSGWRATFFGLGFIIATSILSVLLVFFLSLIFGAAKVQANLEESWGFAAQGLILLGSAFGVGYVCQRAFEDLPAKALGWAIHSGWFKDWLGGSLLGALSLGVATLIATMSGGFKFAIAERASFLPVGKTLIVSCLIFIAAAAAEEALFRGYPLQTLTRANLAWLGIAITSLFFALAHQGNPNQNTSRVVTVLAFTNTALAGVWLSIIYLKTRSLWLPLGAHWAWNWMMAAVLGLPVSGITKLTPNPVFRAADQGPAWLTGGPYGIEGGVACTITLLLSTLFVWRTKWFSATDEMYALTTGENRRRSSIKEDAELILPTV